MAEKIGFVGVGRMGSNMARRLKESGYEIAAVYDVNAAAAQTLAQELGCQAVEELKQVTKFSDVIITVVTDDKAMKNIYYGGLLSRARGKLFINCATISPDVHVWVEGKAEKAGAQSLEACMASSITQAREGSLYLMCGGKAEVFERAKPILEKLSASMRYVGQAPCAWQCPRFGYGYASRDLFPNRRQFPRAANRRRRHAEPGTFLFLFSRSRRKRFWNRLQAGENSGSQSSARRRHQKTVRAHGGGRPGRIGQIRYRRTDL